MFTISLTSLGVFLMKFIALAIIQLFGAVIILWPVNDSPVSFKQKIIFGIFCFISALCVFGVIKFSA